MRAARRASSISGWDTKLPLNTHNHRELPEKRAPK